MKKALRAKRTRQRTILAVGSALAAVSISAAGLAQSQTQPQALAIPAFFSLRDDVQPENTHSREDWNALLDGGSVARIVVLDKSVLSTGSGANDCTNSPASMIDCLHANGSLVLGYVNAQFGCRSQADIESNGPDDDAGVASWDSLNVDGIFLDNVSIAAGCTFDLATFRTIFNDIHARALKGGPDLCNGHACVMTNSSQYPNRDILEGPDSAHSADFSTTYERQTSDAEFTNFGCGASSHQNYYGANANPGDTTGFCPNASGTTPCETTMNPNGWYTDPTFSIRTAHVLSQNPDSLHSVTNAIDQSQSYNAGFMYLSDTLCKPPGSLPTTPTNYGHLTSYYLSQLIPRLGAVLTIDRTTGNTGTGGVTEAKKYITCTDQTPKCTNPIPKFTILNLTAQPDSGSTFAGFFSGTTQICNPNNLNPPPTQCQHTITADETIAAHFSTNQVPGGTLTVNKTGSTGDGTVTTTPAGIDCGSVCTAQFAGGQQVGLNETPDALSVFTHFVLPDGSTCQSNCSVIVPANGSATVTAVFDHPSLAVLLAGTGTGTVSSMPAGISCAPTCSARFGVHTQVSLSAAADGSSTFAGFSGGGCTTSPCTVDLTQDTTVTATFNPGLLCPQGQLRCCDGVCVSRTLGCTTHSCGGAGE